MTGQMLQITETLLAIGQYHNKGYCYPSQKKIHLLAKRYNNWNYSERTLRRRIKDLSDQGYFKVIHRNWCEVSGVKKFRTNLYIPTSRLFKWLGKMAKYIQKVFSFFRRPKMANYSSLTEKEILKKVFRNVEILWKSQKTGIFDPSEYT